DVVVAFGDQYGARSVERGAELVEHRGVAVRPAHAGQVARADAELVRMHRDARDGNARAPQTPRERKARPEQAENDDGALFHGAQGTRASSSRRACSAAAASEVSAARAARVPSNAARRRAGSASSARHASASACASPGGTTWPSPNSRTVSPSEPTSLTTTG